MQKINALFLFLILLSLLSPESIAQSWNTVHPFAEYHHYTNGYFNESGMIILTGNDGRIIKSVNSGQTWETLPSFTEDRFRYFRDLPGTDGEELLLSTQDQVFRSSDAGDSWTPVTSDLSLANIQAVEPISGTLVFTADNSGAIYRSEDGGNSWISASTQTESFFKDISFVSSNQGWAITSNGEVHFTSDGGMSWDSISATETSPAFQVTFLNENIGFVANSQGKFYKTVDGGLSWVEHQENGYNSNPVDLQVISENEMYLLVSGGTKLYYTSDGGVNWEAINAPDYVYNKFNSMKILENNTIWLVGDYQTIAFSEDQGDSWTELFPGYKANLTFVRFKDENIGFAGGAGYHLLKTTDGGQNWESAGIQGPIMTGFEVGTEENLFYARGYNGIWKSIDEGTNWSPTLSGVGFVRTLSKNSAGTLFASTAVTQYKIFRSADNGATWEEQDTPMGLDIRGFAFPTTSTGFAWSHDEIISTVDGGDTWIVNSISFNGNPIDMYFIDNNNGCLLTSSATYFTADGGQNWEQRAGPSGAKSLLFKDTETGWAAGGSGQMGTIYQTIDGGISWELVQITDYPLVDIQYANFEEDEVVAVGNGGIIVKQEMEITSHNSPDRIKSISLFPNPGRSFVILDQPVENGRLTIYNAQGQLLETVLINGSNQLQINTQTYLPGTYFFRVTGNNEQWLGQWIKQ